MLDHMPRLIPPTIAEDTPSEGERVVFDALALAKGADDWVVLHSLDLANHRRRLEGEIDFLIIIPGKGVLVLEVKGTHHLRRHDGLWFYGNDPPPRGARALQAGFRGDAQPARPARPSAP